MFVFCYNIRFLLLVFLLFCERGSSAPLPPRIGIDHLLASETTTRTYTLKIEQQPSIAVAYGTKPLSRLPIAPVIIVRLIIKDSSGNIIVPDEELPFLVANLSLYSGDGESLDSGPHTSGSVSNPPLYGHLISTVHQLDDLERNPGLFFLFPDVSIRDEGRYQLQITLTNLNPSREPDKQDLATAIPQRLAHVRTLPFDVVASSADYVRPPLSPLAKSFKEQGATVIPPGLRSRP